MEVVVSVTALAVSLMALLFTIGSFWWLNARTGRLTATRPRAYAFANHVRLRLPLAFFNTGAKAMIVEDLQVVVDTDAERPPLRWDWTRAVLRPAEDDGFAFATPFSDDGRSTKEVIAEFGDNQGWSPSPGSEHQLRLQAVIHPDEEWVDVAAFSWWAPPTTDVMDSYIAHRNAHATTMTGAQTGAQ
jgi:hypothetical protein